MIAGKKLTDLHYSLDFQNEIGIKTNYNMIIEAVNCLIIQSYITSISTFEWCGEIKEIEILFINLPPCHKLRITYKEIVNFAKDLTQT